MKKKTKNLILSIVVTLILLLTFTITYAVFTYGQTGSDNQQLVLGDIYMHYKESNAGINIDNMMPINIDDYTSYKVNPIMATQTPVAYDNELTRCVNYFKSKYASDLDVEFWKNFCQGSEVYEGQGIHFLIQHIQLIYEDDIQELLELNVIVQDDDRYKVNSVIATQDIGNELYRCTNSFPDITFDEGSTSESFCKGSGTVEGFTFQEMLDNHSFSKEELGYLYDENLITNKEINLPYFEFTISGKNTYTKQDIYYEVVLNHGDTPENRNIRIEDEFLKFRLVEVNIDKTETEIFTNKSYDTLENKRIHVETISKNTMNEINKTYRLYMWIDENVVIGNVDEDYTTEEWKDIFASIKVNVTGDFSDKNLAYEDKYKVTDASCFETEELGILYIHNTNITADEVATCVTYLTEQWGSEGEENTVYVGETYEDFCRGTGTGEGLTFQKWLVFGYFDDENLIYFEENNIIIKNGLHLSITDYDASCGTDVVIPKTIADSVVTQIGYSSFASKQLTSVIMPDSIFSIEDNAFLSNYLSNVEIPHQVTFIEKSAFDGNFLTEVVIPDSVTTIGDYAFARNFLEKVVLGNNVQYIGAGAFCIDYSYSFTCNSITHVINKSGNAFDWADIFGVDSTDGNDEFATGTFKYYLNGDKEVLITKE